MTTPALIPTVVGAIAEIKKISFEEAADHIVRNFEEFFGVHINSEVRNA
jgi:Tat protein secretion system quality control protein TatD with DNase activity